MKIVLDLKTGLSFIETPYGLSCYRVVQRRPTQFDGRCGHWCGVDG